MKKVNAIVFLLCLSLLLVSFRMTNSHVPQNNSMITRHDKDEAEFLKIAEKFEKYMCHLNLPDCEGTIIADQWAISAAHCAVVVMEKFENDRKHFVIVNGEEIEVDKVIMYQEWDDPQEDIGALNDIALLHLKTKPTDAMQAKLYTDEDEIDKLIYMVGRGSKGNGLVGINGHDGKQRGATNRIETATDKWLTWTFDHPDTKTKYLTEFEGISGPGDSGGPAFIVKNDEVYLVGVSSWQDTKDGDEGLYGVIENYTRVSQFTKWINDEMSGKGDLSERTMRIAPQPNATAYNPKAIYVSPSTMNQYMGTYEIRDTAIEVYINENDKKTYIEVAGQQPYEIVPTEEHIFALKFLEGYTIEFKNLENGIFKELIATQPDGVYTATRK